MGNTAYINFKGQIRSVKVHARKEIVLFKTMCRKQVMIIHLGTKADKSKKRTDKISE